MRTTKSRAREAAEAARRSPAEVQARPATPAPRAVVRGGTCPCGGGCPRCRRASPKPGPGGGLRPLEPAVRAFFEARLGHDFGAVRVRSDDAGAAMARRLEARAFTQGEHIVFGAGEFRPHDPAGRHLMAHELAHVVHQRTARRSIAGGGAAEERLEADAERVAGAVRRGGRAVPGRTPAAPSVLRQDRRRRTPPMPRTPEIEFEVIGPRRLRVLVEGVVVGDVTVSGPGASLAALTVAAEPSAGDGQATAARIVIRHAPDVTVAFSPGGGSIDAVRESMAERGIELSLVVEPRVPILAHPEFGMTPPVGSAPPARVTPEREAPAPARRRRPGTAGRAGRAPASQPIRVEPIRALEVEESLRLQVAASASLHADVGGSVSVGMEVEITRTSSGPDAFQLQLGLQAGAGFGIGVEAQGEGAAGDVVVGARGRTTLEFQGEHAAADIVHLLDTFSRIDSEAELEAALAELFPHVSRARADVSGGLETGVSVVQLAVGLAAGGEYRTIGSRRYVGQFLAGTGSARAETPTTMPRILEVPESLRALLGDAIEPRLAFTQEGTVAALVPMEQAIRYQQGQLAPERLLDAAILEIEAQATFTVGHVDFVGTYTITLTDLPDLAEDLGMSFEALLRNAESGELGRRGWEAVLSDLSPSYRDNLQATFRIRHIEAEGVRIGVAGQSVSVEHRRATDLLRLDFTDPLEGYRALEELTRGLLP